MYYFVREWNESVYFFHSLDTVKKEMYFSLERYAVSLDPDDQVLQKHRKSNVAILGFNAAFFVLFNLTHDLFYIPCSRSLIHKTNWLVMDLHLSLYFCFIYFDIN